MALAPACGAGGHPAAPAPDAARVDPTLGALPTGDTVARVEVPRYLGTWYEIASIPKGFQARCAGTTATYGAVDADTISVVNRCRVGGLDGAPVEIAGEADVVDAASRARLEVRFGLFGSAPYWIVDLAEPQGDAPYAWAVVSTPGRDALWFLARTPQIDPARYDAVIARLQARGFEPGRMRRTAQPGA